MPAVDQINLFRNRIDPKHLVSLGGEASCGDGSNITQTEDADFKVRSISKFSFATDVCRGRFLRTRTALSLRFRTLARARDRDAAIYSANLPQQRDVLRMLDTLTDILGAGLSRESDNCSCTYTVTAAPTGGHGATPREQ